MYSQISIPPWQCCEPKNFCNHREALSLLSFLSDNHSWHFLLLIFQCKDFTCTCIFYLYTPPVCTFWKSWAHVMNVRHLWVPPLSVRVFLTGLLSVIIECEFRLEVRYESYGHTILLLFVSGCLQSRIVEKIQMHRVATQLWLFLVVILVISWPWTNNCFVVWWLIYSLRSFSLKSNIFAMLMVLFCALACEWPDVLESSNGCHREQDHVVIATPLFLFAVVDW